MKSFIVPQNLKVLVVDDDAFVRDMLGVILESENYIVETAENGVDALVRYSDDPGKNLIISDMDMPEMNGLELIRQVRKINTDIPIIILTGNNEISVALEAINKGASDYLLKDENIQDTILIAVQKVIEKHLLEKRVDSLLKNTLPETVAEEIKYRGNFEPRQYNCTILFSDFVKFTHLAENMSEESLIKTLDELFMGFDDLMNQFKGTKIKTVGDAYMAVFGAPDKYDEHAAMALRAAIAAIEFVETFNRENNQNFRMRIGIHTGSVMAGVVGQERMQFDVFGDNVNIASRFESSGEKGKINVSEETYSETSSFFEFEERGFISLKNKADMKAYFVVREL
ncbi:MAG: response regulator [Desulfobacteraceae bacterium]|nr:response regulator [Desulfobacteraceae bacterium]